MKPLGAKVLKSVCLTCCFLLLSLTASAQAPDRRQWGGTVGGVQMAVEDAGFVGAGVRGLRVTFRNLRDEEINLYLGLVGGAGVRPCKLDPAPSAPCDL